MTFQDAILDLLAKSKAEVEGNLVEGDSLSSLISNLRMAGWKNVSEDAIEQAGFRIVKGLVGKNTRTGFKYVSPARCVIL